MPPILQTIVDATRVRVDLLLGSGRNDRADGPRTSGARRSLAAALQLNTPAIIAEVKKASPSKGVFPGRFDPLELAQAYVRGGASAISVVTEPQFFLGDSAWLPLLKDEISLPLLRKDFIIDETQVAESAALGADAILLIARILSADALSRLNAAAGKHGLEVLFEIHDLDDLEKIIPLHPAIVGINARNLDDFTVNAGLFHELLPRIPDGAAAVAESGLESHTRIDELFRAGFQGFLVGEILILAADPATMLRRLRGTE